MRKLPLLTLIALSAAARAHEREFTQSRDWFLPYAGEHEVEWRSFFDTTHGGYVAQFEYEYGVTEWFAIEPGLEARENAEGKFEVEGAELELRFHWGTFEYAKWLPALNLEYEQPFDDEDGEEPAVELKGVLSRYGQNGHDVSVNLNVGRQLSGEEETESEMTAGYVLPLNNAASLPSETAGWHHGLRGGAELFQDFESGNLRLGPLLVYRPTEHFNLLTSYLFAAGDRDDGNFDELAVILEWEF